MPTLMVAEEEDKSPLAGCEEISERTGGDKSMDVVEGVGLCFRIAEPESIAELVGAFVDS